MSIPSGEYPIPSSDSGASSITYQLPFWYIYAEAEIKKGGTPTEAKFFQVLGSFSFGDKNRYDLESYKDFDLQAKFRDKVSLESLPPLDPSTTILDEYIRLDYILYGNDVIANQLGEVFGNQDRAKEFNRIVSKLSFFYNQRDFDSNIVESNSQANYSLLRPSALTREGYEEIVGEGDFLRGKNVYEILQEMIPHLTDSAKSSAQILSDSLLPHVRAYALEQEGDVGSQDSMEIFKQTWMQDQRYTAPVGRLNGQNAFPERVSVTQRLDESGNPILDEAGDPILSEPLFGVSDAGVFEGSGMKMEVGFTEISFEMNEYFREEKDFKIDFDVLMKEMNIDGYASLGDAVAADKGSFSFIYGSLEIKISNQIEEKAIDLEENHPNMLILGPGGYDPLKPYYNPINPNDPLNPPVVFQSYSIFEIYVDGQQWISKDSRDIEAFFAGTGETSVLGLAQNFESKVLKDTDYYGDDQDPPLDTLNFHHLSIEVSNGRLDLNWQPNYSVPNEYPYYSFNSFIPENVPIFDSISIPNYDAPQDNRFILQNEIKSINGTEHYFKDIEINHSQSNQDAISQTIRVGSEIRTSLAVGLQMNDRVQTDLRKAMFVFEEFYKSASHVITKMGAILSKLADKIRSR